MLGLHGITDVTAKAGAAGSDHWFEVTFYMHSVLDGADVPITFYCKQDTAAYRKIRRLESLIAADKDFDWLSSPGSPSPTSEPGEPSTSASSR